MNQQLSTARENNSNKDPRNDYSSKTSELSNFIFDNPLNDLKQIILTETPKSRIVEMIRLIFAPTPFLPLSRLQIQITFSFRHVEVPGRSVVFDQHRNRAALSNTDHLGMSQR
jgi:hypothetical protein